MCKDKTQQEQCKAHEFGIFTVNIYFGHSNMLVGPLSDEKQERSFTLWKDGSTNELSLLSKMLPTGGNLHQRKTTFSFSLPSLQSLQCRLKICYAS